MRTAIRSPQASPVTSPFAVEATKSVVSVDSLQAALDVLERALNAPPRSSAEINAWNQSNRDAWVTQVASATPSGARVLDVGAGTCPYRALFAHTDYRSHDFKAYEGVKLGNTTSYGHIDVVSDIVRIPEPTGSYDLILCTEVLEHVPEPIAAMQEMRRLVRPGGRLAVSAPLGSGLHQEPFHYYGGYTPHWYRWVAERLALEVLDIAPNGGFYRHLAQESCRAAWNSAAHASAHHLPPEQVAQLFGRILPQYLLMLDDRVRMPEFTVGYHVLYQAR
jgi:SAM-dependent methyltransferase